MKNDFKKNDFFFFCCNPKINFQTFSCIETSNDNDNSEERTHKSDRDDNNIKCTKMATMGNQLCQ